MRRCSRGAVRARAMRSGARGAGAGASPARLFHTVRHLTARQVAGQLARRLAPLRASPARFAAREAPAWPGCRGPVFTAWLPPVVEEPAARMREGWFAFQHAPERLGWPPEWEAPGRPALWRYHLHYFEFVWALGFEDARALALDWIHRHPLAPGRVGWDAYPTSLRIQNWCGYFFGRHRERTAADAELEAALWRSLYLQAEWLGANLERHLLGNHLLENAVALATAGSCFAGPAGGAWRERGLALLRRELPEQILADGGHFERSPMYHARALHALAGLLAWDAAALGPLLEEPLARMARALAKLCHPDGRIALLGDSALDAQPEPAALLDFCARVAGRPAQLAANGPFALPDSGYYGAREAAGHYVVCDAAPIEPAYQPGHAHADFFSFELSLAGARAVVDAGVFGYEIDERRAYCRSTRAHNTVEVAGEDSCELWGSFRVARRGRPRDVAFEERAGGFALEGWHDGYARLAGAPRHARRFAWHADGVLLVRDRIDAARPVPVCSRLHLHPECRVEAIGPRAVRAAHAGGAFQVCFAGPGELRIEPSRHFPAFGVEREGRVLEFRSEGASLETGFCIAAGAQPLGYDPARGATLGSRDYGL
jgi:uncharacterized heparinase superfamily protein